MALASFKTAYDIKECVAELTLENQRPGRGEIGGVDGGLAMVSNF